jgi:hypothetical protein
MLCLGGGRLYRGCNADRYCYWTPPLRKPRNSTVCPLRFQGDGQSNSRGLNRSVYGHIDFLGQGGTTLQEDVRLCEEKKDHSAQPVTRHTSHLAWERTSLIFASSSFQTSGWIIQTLLSGFGGSLTTAWRATSYPRSSCCVETLQARGSRKATAGTSRDIKVLATWSLSSSDLTGYQTTSTLSLTLSHHIPK